MSPSQTFSFISRFVKTTSPTLSEHFKTELIPIRSRGLIPTTSGNQSKHPANCQKVFKAAHNEALIYQKTYPDNLGVLSLDGEMKSGLQVDVLEVHVRLAVKDELFCHLHVVVQGGQMQGRVAVVLFLVHDPPAGQLRQQNFHCTAKKGSSTQFDFLE